MKIAKLRIDVEGGNMIFDIEKEREEFFSAIKSWLPDVVENNDTISIEICDMDEEEFKSLLDCSW